ncbi:hypothetical protein [Paenibacillus chibensis]|uniref:hypothetical protein n=1 Tax=Paenibacillus chibensis TaxID=59846 RepID=UPI0013E28A29|nr:hypothetical protein [Paenibacillus chibensis]MEC0370969.1 hypothetical protein [Paenibacillus chibensis]
MTELDLKAKAFHALVAAEGFLNLRKYKEAALGKKREQAGVPKFDGISGFV